LAALHLSLVGIATLDDIDWFSRGRSYYDRG
jgi:hypothetical protein